MQSEQVATTTTLDQALRLLGHGARHTARFRKGDDRPGFTPYIMLLDDDPVTPSGVFYLSPDLWVESSIGMNLPVVGEENRVFARVHNLGRMDAANVNVRFYWADPGTAITDQSAHPIGGSLAACTATGVFIPAAAGPGQDSSVVVACPSPWIPAQPTHDCLLAKAWMPGTDPSTAPFEPVLDPVNSRHCVQHNVTVQLLAPGAEFHLSVEVANISGFALPLRVVVQVLDFRETHGRLAALGVPLRDDLVETAGTLPLKVSLSDERNYRHRGNSALGRMLLASEAPPDRRRRDTGARENRRTLVDLVTERFEPWETRQVELRGQIRGGARPGEAYGFEVTQYLGEFETGGYVALLVVQEG